ncbi:MAG: DnaD domain protein [Clostridia bacterium]|nr:DnaD domain protein [Clostridia bacterium]
MSLTSIRYLEKMAIDLHDRGVTTYEALEEELKRVEKRADLEAYVRDLFGLGKRTLIKKEKAFIDTWANTFRFSRDMIAKAYEVTVNNTQGPSMDYANRVLENWYAAGYTAPDEVDAAQAERKAQKSVPEGTSFSTDEFFEAALLRSYGNRQGEDQE